MPKRVLLTIVDKENPRKLFAIEERANGDLMIMIKHTTFRGSGQEDENRIIEHRFSVHRSTESANINVIKRTLRLKSQEVETTRNYTSALKKHDQFATIFAHRAATADKRYDVRNTAAAIISLGNADLTYFQPVFMVLVSNVERSLILDKRPDLNMIELRFSYFRITVLWQFLMPGDGNSDQTLIPRTFSEDEIAESQSDRHDKARMAIGSCDEEALQEFDTMKSLLANAYRQNLLSSDDPDLNLLARFPRDMFTRSGEAFSAEHNAQLVLLGRWIAENKQ